MSEMNKIVLVDSHCHFDLLNAEKPEHYIRAAQARGVQYFLNVSVAMRDFPNVLAVANEHACVYASVGLHPNAQDEEVTVDTLVKDATHDKVVAIGETGLDYYRSSGDLAWQQERFVNHIIAAKNVKKPLIVHTRAAKEDTIRILQQEQASEVGGVMHCFTENWEMAKQALDMNFYISFSGIVTFPNAKDIQEVARLVPLDRMLVETDSPYLAPNPMRGEMNQPGYVYYTAEFIAKLRNESMAVVAEATTNNFFNLFKGAKRNV